MPRWPDTNLKSFSEVASNLIVGYNVNYGANWLILPLFVGPMSAAWESANYGEFALLNVYAGLFYTVVSAVRMFYLRRLFSRFGSKENLFTLVKRLYCHVRKINYVSSQDKSNSSERDAGQDPKTSKKTGKTKGP